MPHPSIVVASRAQADGMSVQDESPFGTAISIVSEEERPCLGFDRIGRRLRLDFEDVVAAESASEQFAPRAPNRDHVSRLTEFAESIREMGSLVLCHCTAGRSSSPVAAIVCLAVWKGPGFEELAARELFAVKPIAYPHRSLIRLADELLKREGRLMRAVEAAQPKEV